MGSGTTNNGQPGGGFGRGAGLDGLNGAATAFWATGGMVMGGKWPGPWRVDSGRLNGINTPTTNNKHQQPPTTNMKHDAPFPNPPGFRNVDTEFSVAFSPQFSCVTFCYHFFFFSN